MLPHGGEETSPGDTALACFHPGRQRRAPLTEQLLQLTASLEASFPRLGGVLGSVEGGGGTYVYG